MQNKLEKNEYEEAVPVLHQYREKFKSKTLGIEDLPKRPPRPRIKVEETAEERSMLIGEGVVLEI
jgi:hypothetical protein